MRLAWVHPSWRDLVIDELAADPAARARFLAVAGIDGVLLALSTGGGVVGERLLPLLVTDADWDTLGDRVHALAAELDARDHARLLDGIAAAIRITSRTLDPRQREADALAEQALARATALWDRAEEALEVDLLRSWHALASRTGNRPAAPALDRTWAALLPASADLDARSELDRVDAWLALCQVLAVHDPPALERLGFPQRHLMLLLDLATALTAPRAVDDPLAAVAASVRARLERFVPDAIVELPRAGEALGVPSEPMPPMRSAGLDPAVDVDRILRDLD
ncbi:MAG TPA: hypothetical protein VF257_13335 [Solirubrobacteraceae bacterium]